MKQAFTLSVMCVVLWPVVVQARNDHPPHANCAQSSSWQCQPTSATSHQTMTGTGPGVSGTEPPKGGETPLGSVPTDVHQTVVVPLPNKSHKGDGGGAPKPKPPVTSYVVPPDPPKQQVPQPMAVLVPPKVLPEQKVPSPMAVPPMTQQQVPQPMAVLVPPKVLPEQRVPSPMAVPPMPQQQVPQPMAVLVPPKVLPEQKVPSPMAVPPMPQQQVPQPMAVLVPPKALPEQKVPSPLPPDIHVTKINKADGGKQVVPPRPLPHQSRPKPLIVTGTGPDGNRRVEAHPEVVGADEHSHALIHHEPASEHPAHVGEWTTGTPYTFEFIEPGVQNQRVEVYRSQDAREMIFKDTIPLDQGLFQLIVIGSRNPAYVH